MKKTLPVRPSLDHLKAQAKDLLDGARRKDAEALARLRDALPSARSANDEALASLKLHDAQSAIAREYGFDGWNALRTHVQSSAPSPEMMRALLDPHVTLPLPKEVLELVRVAAGTREAEVDVPTALPMIALRNALVTRGAIAPLNIGRAPSRAAVLEAGEGGLLAIFPQRNALEEAPSAEALHSIGCVVRLVAVRDSWIVVRGLAWARLEGVDGHVARLAPFAIDSSVTPEAARLDAELRDKVRALAAALPGGDMLVKLTETMSPLDLADVALANVPSDVEAKAGVASEASLTGRLTKLLALLERAS